MNKYDLTQEQWNEMAKERTTETLKSLDEGSCELIPNKQAHAEIIEYIGEIAEKEHSKTTSFYQASHSRSYESNTSTI